MQRLREREHKTLVELVRRYGGTTRWSTYSRSDYHMTTVMSLIDQRLVTEVDDSVSATAKGKRYVLEHGDRP